MIALLLTPVALLFLVSALPSRTADSVAPALRRIVTGIFAAACLAAVAAGVMVLIGGPQQLVFAPETPWGDLGLSFYFDGLSVLMLILVTFVGLVVSRYSERYLDGEATQGRFYRWLSLTVAGVILMTLAGDCWCIYSPAWW